MKNGCLCTVFSPRHRTPLGSASRRAPGRPQVSMPSVSPVAPVPRWSPSEVQDSDKGLPAQPSLAIAKTTALMRQEGMTSRSMVCRRTAALHGRLYSPVSTVTFTSRKTSGLVLHNPICTTFPAANLSRFRASTRSSGATSLGFAKPGPGVSTQHERCRLGQTLTDHRKPE